MANVRKIISRALGLLSVALLTMGILLLCAVCLSAWEQGILVYPAIEAGSNHGRWRGDQMLRHGLSYALFYPFIGFFCAILSYLTKPNQQAAIVAVLAVLFDFFVLFAFLGFVD